MSFKPCKATGVFLMHSFQFGADVVQDCKQKITERSFGHVFSMAGTGDGRVVPTVRFGEAQRRR